MKPDKFDNVVFITIDSLRSDYLFVTNKSADKDISPTLNKLAKNSIVFSQAFSQGPYTRAAFSAIFYSAYLSKVAKLDGTKLERGRIKTSKKSWIEVLNDSGYKTAGFTTNPFTGRLLGYGKGFDCFDDRDLTFSFFIRRVWPKLDKKLKALFVDRIKKRFFTNGSMDSAYINRSVFNWLSTNQPKRFFTWLHYMDVHTPYWNNVKPPKDFDEIRPGELEKLKIEYKRAIKHTDSSIEDLVNFLKKKNLYKRTLIVITSDHGEYFGEHNLLAHPGEYYEQSIKVPLIFHSPQIKKSKFIKRPIELTDIGPTILDYLGNNLIDQFDSDGVSLRKIIETNKSYSKKYVIGETFSPIEKDKKYQPSFYVRGKRYKLIVFPNRNREELYDLKKDKGEQNNIIDQKKALAREMKEYFKEKLNDQQTS